MTHYNPLLTEVDKYPVETAIYSKVKGSPYFQGQEAVDLNDLTFEEVDNIKTHLQDLDDEGIEKVMKLVYKVNIDYTRTRALEFYRAFNHILEEVKEILKREAKLAGKPNEKMKRAGIEKMAIFDTLNILDDLAVKYSVPPHEVEKWRYGNVFIYALKMKFEGDIQRNLNEIEKAEMK